MSRLSYIVSFLAIISCSLNAFTAPVIPRSQADSLASRQVMYLGRTATFATVARDFTLKVTGADHVGKASAEQFLASLILYPQAWSQVPFIKVKDKRVRDLLGMSGSYISPAALYDRSGRYRLETLFRDDGSDLDRQLLYVDEKGVLISEACGGTLFTPLSPADPRLRPDREARTETLYAHLDPWKWMFIGCFATACFGLLYGWRRGRGLLLGMTAATGLWGALSFGMAWTASGRAPLQGTSGTMEAMAACMSLIAIYPALRGLKREIVVAPAGMLLAGAAALTGWIAGRDPVMTPLMPALASPWLPIHVSLVMASYAFLAFTAPAAVTGLLRRGQAQRMRSFSERLLAPGCALLLAGIIIGSIWAKEAWGSYWSWDPKENWAAVTLIMYSVGLIFGRRWRPQAFHIYMLICLLSMIMTYFGVNFLDSLHAYK